MKYRRRSFLTKLLPGVLLGAVSSPLAAKRREQNSEQIMTIKKIRPLGFQWETADPFLFCVHHEDYFPKGNEQMGPDAEYLRGRQIGQDFVVKDGFRMYHGNKVPGFPGHPHRGFETITVVRRGLVDHADSTGAAGRYGNGDVQWMTAGKGVMHSEMFPLLRSDADNPLELFQIWLNLPARSKMVEPHFKMFWAEQVNRLRQPGLEVEVLVGRLGEYAAPAAPPDSWAADPGNEVAVYNIRLEAGAEWTLPAASPGINRTLYYYRGKGLMVGGTAIPEYHAVEVEPDRSLLLHSPLGASKILLLQGRPINEPVVQYGPFVMNSREEIRQAFDEYNRTQFGGWPWASYDQVHDRKLGRFARYADGKEEHKG